MPVGLRNDGHAVACGLQSTTNNCHSEGRVVHIGITREEDDIYILPTSNLQLFAGCRQEIGQHHIIWLSDELRCRRKT